MAEQAVVASQVFAPNEASHLVALSGLALV